MPQPIKITDSLLPEWLEVSHDPDILATQPELAAQLAVTLSTWAKVDTALLDLLTSTVPDPEKGETLNAAIPAMYYSIINLTSRLDLVGAAVRLRRPNHFDEFTNTLAPEIRRRAQERVPIAHGEWTYWDRYPNALILRSVLDFKGTPPMKYTEKDFRQIQERVIELAKKIDLFTKSSRPNKS